METLARSIYKDATQYGFGQLDFVRLINELMDICTGSESDVVQSGTAQESALDTLQSADFGSLPIRGPRLVVRKFEDPSDKEFLERWLPERYGRYFFLSSVTAQPLSVDALIQGESNELAMITLYDGTPIGAMAYLDINEAQKRAELRKLIGDRDSRGKGFAEEASRLWIRYGAEALDLQKIYLSTLQTQLSNIRLNESLGFRHEGLLVNEVLIDGMRHDVLRMGLSINREQINL